MQNQEYLSMFKVEQSHWWYKGLRQILKFWVNKVGSRSILDAGCGTGMNMQMFDSENKEIHGIDPSELAIGFCKQRGLQNLSKGFIQKMDYENEKFDTVYCMDVLGILDDEDIEKSIIEFSRVIKNNGSLIINSAALDWLYSKHDLACNLRRRFYKKELVEILERNNYKIVKATYRVFLLFPLVALVKIIEKIGLSGNKKVENGDLEKTNVLFNTLFPIIMFVENKILQIIDLPIGTSIFIVAQKN